MTALEARWLSRLADVPLLRRVMEPLAAARNRRHLVRLNQLRADRAQLRTLLTLVHRARGTPVARDHDFARVRTPADFRRLVPLDATPTPNAEPRLPAAALRTAMALVQQARPATRFLDSSLVWVDDKGRSTWLPAGGVRDLFLGRDPADFGPHPAPLLPGRRSQLAVLERGGDDVPVLDLLLTDGVPVALADARLGGWRLLVDHEVYFEFVPVFADAPEDIRVPLADVRPGVAYEVVLTTHDRWAHRTDLVVCFDQLTPPVVRVLPSLPHVRPTPPPAPASHQRTADTPAARPETSAHIAWSALADRG